MADNSTTVSVQPQSDMQTSPTVQQSTTTGEVASAPASAPAVEPTTTAVAAAASTTDTTTESTSRKRRSRWADPTPSTTTTPTTSSSTNSSGTGTATEDGTTVRKKSRWSQPTESTTPATSLPPPAQQILATLTPEQLEAFKIQLRIDELTRHILNPTEALREKEAQNESQGRARSPSPEPIYDPNGLRLNTRAQRYVKTLEKERQELIESLQKANPNYKPPAGFKKIRYERRLPIPIKEYPDYNFIGMIIGPRGHTQKRMEKESGCKIVIRGRGSTKEGRAGHKPQPGDDDELHVLIAGDNEASVIATTKEVEKLLIPIDETRNEHKARQLRELAVINGTLRDEIICRLCGQAGHRQIQCPQRNQNWQPANIRCNICGSEYHPSADCPQRFTRTAEQSAQDMNDEYSSFMNEIVGDGQSGPIAQRSAQPLYLTDGNGHGGGGPDGGGGGGGPSSSTHPPPPPPPPPTNMGPGYIHPDRLATRGDPNVASYRDREGGQSRFVKGNDPRETFREFRPSNAPVTHLPTISHRDGFRDVRDVRDSSAYSHSANQPHSYGPPPPTAAGPYGHPTGPAHSYPPHSHPPSSYYPPPPTSGYGPPTNYSAYPPYHSSAPQPPVPGFESQPPIPGYEQPSTAAPYHPPPPPPPGTAYEPSTYPPSTTYPSSYPPPTTSGYHAVPPPTY